MLLIETQDAPIKSRFSVEETGFVVDRLIGSACQNHTVLSIIKSLAEKASPYFAMAFDVNGVCNLLDIMRTT